MRVHRYGGPEVIQADELPEPEPGPGQVRVRVEAAGVNFMDVYHRTGYYRTTLPKALGVEGAGVVDAVGPGATSPHIGDRVAWVHVEGSYATAVLVDAKRLVPVPDDLSLPQAAAALEQGLTAHYLAHSIRPFQPGDTCVVHAAAGGVGGLLCQLAAAQGVRVIGVVSTAMKAEVATEAGAAEVIIGRPADFDVEVRRLTDGRGADAVFDGVGAATWEASMRSLAVRGSLVLFGQPSGAVPPIDPYLLSQHGSISLSRPALRHYIDGPELLERADQVFTRVLDGRLRLRVGSTYELTQAAAAHEALESRRSTGKLLLLN